MQPRISANRVVVDASVAIKWYLDDEEHVDEARAVLAAYVANEIAFLAPDHIRYEVPNAILVAARRRRIDPATAKLAVSNFLVTRMAMAGSYSLLNDAYDYAMRYECAFYDALYLALADQWDCPFVHADRRLHNTLAGRFLREVWIEDYEAS